MKQYLALLQDVLDNGVVRSNRTGVDAKSVFGRQIRFNCMNGFPLMTTKQIHFKSVVHELLWFLRGDTNIRYLRDNGVTIWDEWAVVNPDKWVPTKDYIGRGYGYQWRRGFDYDQLKEVIHTLKTDPLSRRHLVTAWNPTDLDDVVLPPCHIMYQFYVHNDLLSCHMYMRSADIFLGVPFNIASYALLMALIANCTNLRPGELIISFGDLHLYTNHIEQAKLQLSRTPMVLPTVYINKEKTDIDSYQYNDIQLIAYYSHPGIKADVAV